MRTANQTQNQQFMLMACQCVAVCCSVLQCTSQSHDCDLQEMRTQDRTSIHVLSSQSVSAETACTSNTITRPLVRRFVVTLQHCNMLQQTATHCNTLQHTAVRSFLATFKKAAKTPLAFLPHPSSFLSTSLFTTRPP